MYHGIPSLTVMRSMLLLNSCLNIYVRIFYYSFPPKTVINRNNNDGNNWITLGIRTSCRHKRELYLAYRNSNNLVLKRHYQVYCKILSNVIKEAKRIYYNKKKFKSSNNCKTTWDIIKELSSDQHSKADIQELTIDCKHLKDQQDIVDVFNNYLSSKIDKISKNNVNDKISDENLSSFHYYVEQNYVHPSSSLVFKTFSTKEITSVIKLLKTKNSYGYEISTKLLKISATYVCSPLTYMCNKSYLVRNFFLFEVLNYKTYIKKKDDIE